MLYVVNYFSALRAAEYYVYMVIMTGSIYYTLITTLVKFFYALRAEEYLDHTRLCEVITMEMYLEEYSDYIKLYKVIIMRSRTLPSRGPLCEEMSYFVNASWGRVVSAHFLPTYPPGLTYLSDPLHLARPAFENKSVLTSS